MESNNSSIGGLGCCAMRQSATAALDDVIAQYRREADRLQALRDVAVTMDGDAEAALAAEGEAIERKPGTRQFRKKPVVIEAFQMTEERRQDNRDWPSWLNEAWNKPQDQPGAVFPKNYPESDGKDELCIFTLEGLHLVQFGDWIIRGVKGELYPCKPEIFAATYDEVTQ